LIFFTHKLESVTSLLCGVCCLLVCLFLVLGVCVLFVFGAVFGVFWFVVSRFFVWFSE